MLVEYCVISGVNALLMFSGAFVVIASKHSLAQWRLNKPAAPTTKRLSVIPPVVNVVAPLNSDVVKVP